MNQLLPSIYALTPGLIEVHYIRPLFDTLYSVDTPEKVDRLIKKMVPRTRLDVKEFFWVLFLTSSNRLLGVAQIGEGSVRGVVVNHIEIFQIAFAIHASAIILCHNHPSGNTFASTSDLQTTLRIKQVCGLLDMTLLDHIIITSETYRSLATSGEL